MAEGGGTVAETRIDSASLISWPTVFSVASKNGEFISDGLILVVVFLRIEFERQAFHSKTHHKFFTIYI